MGGKRIADQVRRALITAAKTSAVVVAIDATGCEHDDTCAIQCPPDPLEQCGILFDTGAGGITGTGGASTGGRVIFPATGGRVLDASEPRDVREYPCAILVPPREARAHDAAKPDAGKDASRD